MPTIKILPAVVICYLGSLPWEEADSRAGLGNRDVEFLDYTAIHQ